MSPLNSLAAVNEINGLAALQYEELRGISLSERAEKLDD
jgi:hypothetical protein